MLKYKLQNIRLTSSQAALTISSIPNTYDDLYLLVSVRSTNADDNLYFRFNNTTANTSWRNLLGFGTGVLSQSGTGWLAGGGIRSGIGTSDYANIGIYIPNYAGSTPKTAMVDSTSGENGSNGYQFLTANLWNDTAAINRIDFYMQGGNLENGSKVSVYGIKRGADGRTQAVATGGTITTSGGYTYHTFTSSSTFVANRNMMVEALVVGGGGSGGPANAGGGGAGGYLAQTIAVSPGSYAVTIGAGGAQVSSTPNSGSPTTFLSALALGGGRGGDGSNSNPAAVGGSGGGAGGQSSFSTPGAAGTAGQGNAGGASSSYVGGGYNGAGGGGGGASAAGGNAGGNGGVAGAGGAGSQWLNGSYYAGGGGGGANNINSITAGSGGIGGGGNGGPGTGGVGAVNGAPGTANTGGGGGGGGGQSGVANGSGGNGGSGVVIIRYLTPA